MPWTTTHDPGEFLAAAGGFMRSRLVEHNVILTITAAAAGWPGRARRAAQAGAAWRFARRWQVRTGASASLHRRQRLYRLGQLAPADPPPGRARRAADADRDLLHAWHDAFLAELGSTSIRDVPAQVADRLGYGGLVLWEARGVPVSMAGRTR
jgi:hypothetical protein